MKPFAATAVLVLACTVLPAEARTVYRCVRDGTVSMATAPEPGSRCEAKHIDDNAMQTPNLWGNFGVFSGVLYEREQDGKKVYSTRNLPGSTPFLKFTVATPEGEPAHPGMGKVGKPRLDLYSRPFKAAAKKTGVDEAVLRAIAHAESGYDAKALSPKGAQGLMQLMPEVASEYGVKDPYSADQSIDAAARHIKLLMRRYGNDLGLVAAAYNAGIGAVTRYKGVPPYAETQAYVDKVLALHARYREALGPAPLRPADATQVASPTARPAVAAPTAAVALPSLKGMAR